VSRDRIIARRLPHIMKSVCVLLSGSREIRDMLFSVVLYLLWFPAPQQQEMTLCVRRRKGMGSSVEVQTRLALRCTCSTLRSYACQSEVPRKNHSRHVQASGQDARTDGGGNDHRKVEADSLRLSIPSKHRGVTVMASCRVCKAYLWHK